MTESSVALQLITGAIVAGYAVAGLFFLRFWRQTGDRLFLIFSASFCLLGVQRLALELSSQPVEARTGLYLLRLFAFVLILAAIVDKTVRRGD